MPSVVNKSLTNRDIFDFVLLSAIWGASFLFLRVAAPEFGPVFLIELRGLSALIVLLPVCVYLGKIEEIRQNWKLIFTLSLCNTTLPFCLLAYAVLSINAGLASILNATVPFFTALVAYIMWSQKLSISAVIGMLVGFAGVSALVLDSGGSSQPTENLLAIGAAVLASLLYGTAANITYYKLSAVSGIAATVGALGFASLVLLPFAIVQKPEQMPTGAVWLSVIALGVVCTGVAYLLFYRLISRIGSHRAVSTTFLIPPFSILWGSMFLGEELTISMALACLLVLVGVYITTGRYSALFSVKKQH